MNMTHPVVVTPFQLKLKAWSIWIESQFDRRSDRATFAVHAAGLAAAFYILYLAETAWFAESPWPVHVVLSLVFAAAAVWTILQIVRRFHDMGRTGGLFWAVAIPYWALGKMIGHFPDLWIVWVLLCAIPIKLTLELFFRAGAEPPPGV
jgi:uncharacterized membrane protein YhaH (DUF805 family)